MTLIKKSILPCVRQCVCVCVYVYVLSCPAQRHPTIIEAEFHAAIP